MVRAKGPAQRQPAATELPVIVIYVIVIVTNTENVLTSESHL